MSPLDEMLAKRERLAELRAWELALAILDATILDADETAHRTTVHEEAPLWRFAAHRLRKLKDEVIAAASKGSVL